MERRMVERGMVEMRQGKAGEGGVEMMYQDCRIKMKDDESSSAGRSKMTWFANLYCNDCQSINHSIHLTG